MDETQRESKFQLLTIPSYLLTHFQETKETVVNPRVHRSVIW